MMNVNEYARLCEEQDLEDSLLAAQKYTGITYNTVNHDWNVWYNGEVVALSDSSEDGEKKLKEYILYNMDRIEISDPFIKYEIRKV